MPKDEFTDLLDFGEERDENGTGDEGTLATVIKNEQLTVDDEIALVTDKKVIESETFTLKLFQKDGIIDSIEIECKCGRTARIQLEYQRTSIDDEEPAALDNGDNAEENPDTAPESPANASQETTQPEDTGAPEHAGNDEEQDFHEGIPTKEINDLSQQKIISPEPDETQDTE